MYEIIPIRFSSMTFSRLMSIFRLKLIDAMFPIPNLPIARLWIEILHRIVLGLAFVFVAILFCLSRTSRFWLITVFFFLINSYKMATRANWLSKIPNGFDRRKFMYPFPSQNEIVDIAYMNRNKHVNPIYHLFIMDSYNKYLDIYPVKMLKSVIVKPLLETIFSSNIYKYKNLLP